MGFPVGVRIPPLAPVRQVRSPIIENVKVSITETSTWLRGVDLEIPREHVEKEERRLLQEYRTKLRLDGFRRGKVPETIVRQRYGEQIRIEAIDAVLPGAIGDALKEHAISPLAPPRVEKLDYGESGPMTVHAVVEVMPEFEVTGYEGLKLEKVVREVTDDDVETALRDLAERTAELVPVERAAEYGDFLLADIQTCDEGGTPIIGQKTENRTLQVVGEGEGSEVGRQLAGVTRGDDRRVVVTHEGEENGTGGSVGDGSGGGGYPEAGAGAHRHVFLVQVKEVKEKRLPALDDEYARAIGDFADLADLRDKIRADLEEHSDAEARRVVVGQAIDQIVRRNSIEVPESLVRRYLDGVVAEHQQAAGEGQTVDAEAIRQQYRGIARMQLTWQMISARLAEQEGIEAPEEEVRERINAFAANYRMDPDEAYRAFVQNRRIDRLRADIREEKVVDLILEQAKVKEKTVAPKKKKRLGSFLTGRGTSPDEDIMDEEVGEAGGSDREPDRGTGGSGGGLIIPGR